MNIYLFIFHCSSHELLPVVLFICFAFLISGVAVIAFKNAKHKSIVCISTFVFSALFLLCFIFSVTFTYEGIYFEYSSEGVEHHIVVEEKAFLLSCWGTVYEKTSFCTMTRVGQFNTNDVYRPFSFDEFYFVWNEKDFELHYNDGSVYYEGNGGYKTETMNYSK